MGDFLPAYRICTTTLVAPATDRFVRDHDITFEQQLLDVVQVQAEPQIGDTTLPAPG
jgi:hypothetical protein